MMRSTLLAILLLPFVVTADDWPQWFGPKRDGIWRETGILAKFPAGGPKQVWRADLGPGYSGPAVADGLLYVTDRVLANKDEKVTARAGTTPGKERVLCLNAATGKEVWKYEYDCTYEKISYGFGPRTTPTIVGDKVYTLGTMGDLLCLESKTGKVIWEKHFPKDFAVKTPAWGWSSNPLIDGDQLICLVGGENHVVVSFDRNNGKVLWHALTAEEIGYAPPVIFEQGGKRQLIIWHSEAINSLNPATGEVYWREKFPHDVRPDRPAAPISTPQLSENILFVSAFYHGPFALELDAKTPKAKVAWRSPNDDKSKVQGVCALINTPVIRDGHIYGISRSGELICHELKTGKKLWESLEHQDGKSRQFGTTFIIPHQDRFLLFTDAGDLIIAQLSPTGYKLISRAKVITPTQPNSGRNVVWTHPAFANKCLFVRSDKEIVCVSLAE